MRLTLSLILLLGTAVFADVPGPKQTCDAPAGCVACAVGDAPCFANAEDAGLILSDCVSHVGTPSQYVCPPGHPAVARCGCSSAGGLSLIAAGALSMLLRRRAR